MAAQPKDVDPKAPVVYRQELDVPHDDLAYLQHWFGAQLARVHADVTYLFAFKKNAMTFLFAAGAVAGLLCCSWL
eukprot:m.79760 g.79760  ORF g.79760 m.79760 type:complete len:75 (+) comp14805_c0_seq15:334-558(+)